MWLSICFVAIVAYILHHYYDEIRACYLMWNVIGPTSYPIIGSGHYFINKTSPEIFDIAIYLVNRFGTFFKLWLGPELKIVLQDPKDMEIVLSGMRYIDKSKEYDLIRPWLSDGLLLSTGKKWHNRRKIMTPGFHLQMLEKSAEIFDRLGEEFVSKLNEYDADAEIELYHLIGLFTLDVVCETTMGVSIDALSKPNSEYIKAVKDISHVALTRAAKFALRHPLIYKFSKLRKIESEALQVLHGFTDDVIRKRRQELTENNNATNEVGSQQNRALLDILLHSTIDGQPLSDLDIREEVDVFMFAGHDTTVSAITFCLYNIAKYPEVQKKCFNEVVKVFGTAAEEQPATLLLLNQLHYLEATIKESMRLFATLPVILRRVMEDIELTKNRLAPKGSTIAITFFSIFRNEEYFDEAEKFQPERFMDEQIVQKRHPYTFLPFSAGPRNCIGQKFAMYEMKSILSKILRNFEISLTKDSEMEPTLSAAIVLRPESAIKFKLKHRT